MYVTAAMTSAVGISLAATLWIPFAIIGEVLSHEEEMRVLMQDAQVSAYIDIIVNSDPNIGTSSPRQRKHSVKSLDLASMRDDDEHHPDLVTSDMNSNNEVGAVLGMHNVFVVLPQILSSLVSSAIFMSAKPGPSGIETVWRFGAGSVLIAMLISLKL
jgi:solute carrier family 45 protein 1/2/4